MKPSTWRQPGVHGPYAHDDTLWVVHVTSGPDGLGCQSFYAVWWDEGWERRRAQHFHANVEQHVLDMKRTTRRRPVVIDLPKAGFGSR